ncbi:MAG TPA: restriction endonuclease subunit S, partial [Bacteroidales bacterium]
KLGEITEKPQYGTSKKCDYGVKGIAVLRIPNIANGFVDCTDLKYAKFEKEEIENYQLKEGDILTIRSNGSVDLVGKCALISKRDEKFLFAGYLIKLRPKQNQILPKFLINVLSSCYLRNQIESKAKSTSGVNNINSEELKGLIIPLCSLKEQQIIISKLENKLTICDKLQETINQNLQLAETLRQSILKKAFEGKLVNWQPEVQLEKPRNVYFYQMQVLGLIAKASKEKQIRHGEMTLAKYSYLLDKVYKIPTYYDYKRWHLGPYPPEMKKAVNNKDFFAKDGNYIEVVNAEKLFGYHNAYRQSIEEAVSELAELFSSYSIRERSHKTELLATVCKVVEDIQCTDPGLVCQSMKEWTIELDGEGYKNKAEKFTEQETMECLVFLKKKGWDKKLMEKQ